MKNRRTLVGNVISDKMDKVVTVQWEVRKQHPLYKKFITYHSKLKARDKNNEASKGDVVKVVETRPLTKDTHWSVAGIIEKAQKET